MEITREYLVSGDKWKTDDDKIEFQFFSDDTFFYQCLDDLFGDRVLKGTFNIVIDKDNNTTFLRLYGRDGATTDLTTKKTNEGYLNFTNVILGTDLILKSA